MTAQYTITETKELEHSAVSMTATIAWDVFGPYYERRLDRMVEHVEIDGFRKGKAPREQVEQEIGQMQILQQASQDLLGDVYPAMVLEKQLSIIGYPQIAISKIAYGSELEFSVTTAVMPELTLPDYKQIAQDINKEEISVEVTDEEFDAAVERIRNMYAHTASGDKELAQGDSETEHDLPELTDEFVAKLGDYSSVDDFKTKFREELAQRKTNDEMAKRREQIITTISEQTQLDLPEVLIESEKDKMLAAIKDDIARMGLEYKAWLEHSGKTEEDMKQEMHEDATKRAQAELILKTIARTENISPDEETMTQQVSMIQEVHKDVPEENIRAYLENILLNEAVLAFLDAQK